MIATVNEVYDILQAMKNQQENTIGRICRICPSARRPFVRHNPTCNLATLNKYAYQYDDIGNRLSSLDLGTNRTYTANSLNQYTLVGRDDPIAPHEEFSPQYDLDGNQTLVKTSTGVWSVTYNAENRPVLWECGATNIVMKFDRMGRRVEYIETVADSTGGPSAVSATTNAHHRFVYDGYVCIQRLNAASNNAIDLVFGWDPSEPVATRPLVLQKYGQYSLFYTHDGNKNVSELIFFQQANGIAAHYEYAPFGAVTAASRSTPVTAYDFRDYNPFRFSSEYEDGALGLVYYNYRHYSTIVGGWQNRDMHDYRRMSLYSFCHNASVSLIDVLGRSPVIAYPQPGPVLPLTWDCASARQECLNCIGEWRTSGYNFAADLFEYYLNIDSKKKDFEATSQNLSEIKQHSQSKVCQQIGINACEGNAASRNINISPSDASESNIRWWYLGDDNNMLYAYGGARLTVRGSLVFDGPRKWRGDFDVSLEDYYEWEKNDGFMDKLKETLSRMASNAYAAAVYLQTRCGYRPFYHKETFSLQCSGCCD